MKLSTRQHDIVRFIFNQDDYVTALAIADSLSVSVRTVKRELDEIEYFLQHIGVNLMRKSGKGIAIEKTPESEKILETLLQKTTYSMYSQRKRVTILLLTLLFEDEPIKRFALAEKLAVSEMTVSSDLYRVEEILQQKSIKLIRKQGYGIYIVASEHRRRNAIVEVINNAVKGFSVNDISSKTIDMFVNKKLLQKIIDSMTSFNNITHLYKSDHARDNLALQFYVMLKRAQSNNRAILEDNSIKNEVLEVSESLIKHILNDISDKTKTSNLNTLSEIEYFAQVLKSTRGLQSSLLDEESTLANSIAQKLAFSIASKFGIIVELDNQFFISLIRHIVSLIYRDKKDMEIVNPILDDIKDNYSELFKMTKECCYDITKEVGIKFSESEIGYLTLHLCVIVEDGKNVARNKCRVLVVCPGGLVVSQLLAMSLKKEFSMIEVVDTSSTANAIENADSTKNVTLVISTAPIIGINLPNIVVNSIMTNDDKQKIYMAISSLSSMSFSDKINEIEMDLEKSSQNKRICELAIEDIISTMIVWEDIDCGGVSGLIDMVSDHFGVSYEHSLEIAADLRAREKISSTVMPDGQMMLLHARSNGVTRPCFGIVKATEKLLDSEENEDVKTAMIMITPKMSDKNVIKLFNVISQTLIGDDAFYENIKAYDLDESKNLIKTLLYNYYKNLG